jgi:uncharacterized protein YuzE
MSAILQGEGNRLGCPLPWPRPFAKGEDKGKLRVSVHGFDYYNTKTGNIESGGEDKIAVAWVERVLARPEWTEPDPLDAALEHPWQLFRSSGTGFSGYRQHFHGPAAGHHSLFRPQENPAMKLKIDEQADALYLTLGEAPASRTEEVSPGIIVDYDDQDRVVGIEMLYLSKRAPQTDIRRFLFEAVPEIA